MSVPLMIVLWSVICVAGAAGLMYFVMHSHMELRLAIQREELASLQATLAAKQAALEESMRNAEAAVRSRAMDEFLADIRVEERHHTREHRILFMTRKMLVRQERIFFRNIPLSNWVEQEIPIEEGIDADKMASAISVFANVAMGEVPAAPVIRRLLR
jgi:hypothetical protein